MSRGGSGTASRTCPTADLIVLPGGFAYGDYLRCGAMAAHSPIMREVKARAEQGHAGARHLQRLSGPDRGRDAAGRVVAEPLARTSPAATCICGSRTTRRSSPAATRPARRSGCRWRTTTATTPPTPATLDRLEGEGLVAFRYCGADGDAQRQRQFQRLGPRHRRHLQRQPHRAGADAASRKCHRPAPRRHRRPGLLLRARGRAAVTNSSLRGAERRRRYIPGGARLIRCARNDDE